MKKGNKHTKATKKQISKSMKGHPVSAEARKKMSDARKAYWKKWKATKEEKAQERINSTLRMLGLLE